MPRRTLVLIAILLAGLGLHAAHRNRAAGAAVGLDLNFVEGSVLDQELKLAFNAEAARQPPT